jgi:hypothetical protein
MADVRATTEDTHITTYVAAHPIVPYPHSETSASPSPLIIDRFLGEDSPSPPASPSPHRTPTSTYIANAAPTTRRNDTMMEDPPADYLGRNPPQTAQNPPRPLTHTRSEGDIPIIRAPLPTLGLAPSIAARLKAAAERNAAATTNASPSREPIDKYTCADMPTVHDAHPTAPLDHINIDLVGQWEKYDAGKLLALPFDRETQDITLYNSVKERIFTAVAEITKSREIGVSAPQRSEEAEELGRFPSAFLIYSLTDAQCDLLLQRKVWSSTAITFRVTKLNPPCPDLLFTIYGFSTLVTDDILNMVRTVWQGNDVLSLIDTIANSFPEAVRITAKSAIQAFINSVKVTRLDYKSSGDTLQPHFNVYASSSLIENDDIWAYLREFLANCSYASPMHGQGMTRLIPFHCSLCHGADHPRGLCPFPTMPGWNGPDICPSNAAKRGRGGRMRGLTRGPTTCGRR